MSAQQLTNVGAGQHIAVKDQHWIIWTAGQSGRSVADSATCTQWLILGEVNQFHPPIGTVTEEFAEHFCLIGGPQHDPGDTSLPGTCDLVGGKGHTGNREHGFRRIDSERPQSSTFAAYQQNCFHESVR